ncbi:MAG TPA: bifunctional phosphopantothenoylcysteine decarboxylase/phosphopantothenate--cysteine ligase CoaBC [Gaiellaceae bacterium]|nr:bifunctional phosphopantothenoylcysteine decarboxylase/phosphopantothenate--cysteine ligase CoaBC [Gaiellaceae bacterium]
MARILLGVTGGIAAYKACELVRLLVKAGHDVLPLPTRGSERFVRAETFFALARKSPSTDPYPHLERADLLVIAPLTAHTLAKLAHGLADDVLTEAALAHRGPVLVAPAMNTRMWEHEATQANAATLRARGVELIGPEAGELAEGEIGPGRMTEPDEIARRVEALLGASVPETRSPLAGARVLVSAGGTREPLDAVRFLGNRSSGRMGVALAAEARRRGAEVTLLASNLTVPAPDGVEVVETPTAADLEREATQRAGAADVVVMAAAVADYRPREQIEGKRAKSADAWTVELAPTTDVLAALGEQERNGQVLVGFGAEAGADGLERKRRMLTDKNLDLVVYNDVSVPGIGFDAPDNEVTLLTQAGQRELARASKEEIAAGIVDEVERLLEGRRGSS